ncbi:MAG: hypothetical protein AB1449_09220 [Chloroflexota bacterium]
MTRHVANYEARGSIPEAQEVEAVAADDLGWEADRRGFEIGSLWRFLWQVRLLHRMSQFELAFKVPSLLRRELRQTTSLVKSICSRRVSTGSLQTVHVPSVPVSALSMAESSRARWFSTLASSEGPRRDSRSEGGASLNHCATRDRFSVRPSRIFCSGCVVTVIRPERVMP